MQQRPRLTGEILLVSLVAALAGASAGLLGVAFRLSVEAVGRGLGALSAATAGVPLSWLVPTLAAAALAGAAFWLVHRFAPEAGGSGVQEIEGALAEVRPARWRRVIPVKFAGAVLALGSGMVLGREGPTVQMGGNLGAMWCELLRMGRDARHVLIASGAAAGLAAAFNAPLSGVLFVVEEMRPQFRYGFLSFQAVLIAAVCADVVTRVFMGDSPLIETGPVPSPPLAMLLLFLVYGGVLGAVAVVFTRSLMGSLSALDRLGSRGRLLAAAAVGGAVGLAGWLQPEVVGGGYHLVHDVFSLSHPARVLLLLFLVRFALTIASYASGVPGGIFAPMLALGILLGMAFGQLVGELAPLAGVDPRVYAVAGMAAFFAATVRAPLTGIALTVEITGDFGVLLPVLVACMAATFAAEGLGARPVYEMLLERTLSGTEQKGR